MSGPVVVNDVLTFPVAGKTEITIKWSQTFKDRSEKYYVIPATNTSRGGAGVNLFVQKDLFDNQLASFATVDGENAKATVTDKFQYGQKNKEGANRFVVFHDTSRKPYQHRFVETTLQSQLGGYAKGIASNMGYESVSGTAENFAKAAFGDYLKAY